MKKAFKYALKNYNNILMQNLKLLDLPISVTRHSRAENPRTVRL